MNTIEKIWNYILMGVVITIVVGLVLLTSSSKRVVRYELSGSNGIPGVCKNIENGGDEYIQFSKEISWGRAIQMVDSLNKTLK